ncbi:hypothetical protein Ddye_003373 [Dipteronia dyeriana]|uniref:Uncharacterized protein n=1 Tax=Dipteronia dyeriana TaxID=168575 RepID=A0AAD9XS58_9ROSI|nr:hypothetical protein Ddye_003373 [Dipteronia dyeriana]
MWSSGTSIICGATEFQSDVECRSSIGTSYGGMSPYLNSFIESPRTSLTLSTISSAIPPVRHQVELHPHLSCELDRSSVMETQLSLQSPSPMVKDGDSFRSPSPVMELVLIDGDL